MQINDSTLKESPFKIKALTAAILLTVVANVKTFCNEYNCNLGLLYGNCKVNCLYLLFMVMFSLVSSFNPLVHMSFLGHMKFKLQLTYQVKWQQLRPLQLSSNMVRTSFLAEIKEVGFLWLMSILHDQDFLLCLGYCCTWSYISARGTTTLDKGSGGRWDPYMPVHNIHKRDIHSSRGIFFFFFENTHN